MRPCRPRLSNLKQILQSSAFRGPELEQLSTRLVRVHISTNVEYALPAVVTCCSEDLLDSVQASERNCSPLCNSLELLN